MKILKSSVAFAFIFLVSSFSFAEYTSLKQAVNDNTTNIKEYSLIKDEKLTTSLGVLGGTQLTIFGGNIYNVDGNSNYGINIGKYKILNIDCLTLANFKKLTISSNETTFDNSGGVIYSSSGTINITSTIFNSNEVQKYGGVIYISSGAINVTSTIFNSNEARNSNGAGGAIYISSGAINVSLSEFIVNKSPMGGAIYNQGTGNIISTIFSSNKATSRTLSSLYGGAIYNTGTLTIDSTTFSSNQATAIGKSEYDSCGGAIYNKGELTINSTTFNSNKAFDYGGAIYNSRILTISSTTFSLNEVSATIDDSCGGAIYNTGTLTISSTIFISNQAKETSDRYNYNVYGGAIYNTGTLRIISSTIFSLNEVSATNNSCGGAIYNTGTLTIDSTTFSSNQANAATKIYGGAIYNTGTLTISATIFSSNQAKATSKYSYGGAIYNSRTLTISSTTFSLNEVSATNNSCGGAIYNTGTLTISATIFSSNKAKNIGGVGSNSYGGAIYNNGTLNLIAEISDIEFIGNKVNDVSNAIHNNDRTINLWASKNADIIFNDRITGLGTLNINSSTTTLNAVGKVVLNEDMSGYTGQVNLYNGEMELQAKIAEDSNVNTNKIFSGNINLNNGTLNILNNAIDNITVNNLQTTSNANLNFDVDLSNNTSDNWTITNNAVGELNLTAINILGADEETGQITLFNNEKSPVLNILTTANYGGYEYTFTNNDISGILNYERTGLIIKTFKEYINAAEPSIRSYSLANDEIVTVDLGQLGGEQLTIFGNEHNVEGSNIEGIFVASDKTLNIENVNSWNGFNSTYGAIKNEGTLNISGTNFTGNQEQDIINNGNLTLSGILSSFEKGIVGVGTTTISGVSINLNNTVIEQSLIKINSAGQLTTKTQNIVGKIENNSNLMFSEGTNNNYIYGNGITTIDGEVVNSSTIATNVKINGNKQLTTIASNIMGNINNLGSYILTGGENKNLVYGIGTTTINGEVINSSTIATNVRINENKKLTTNATNINGQIENDGNLIFNGGTNNSYVYGAGKTIIEGDVISNSTISNNITINNNKRLSTIANKITGNINNLGEYVLTGGENKNQIYGTGITIINGEVINSSIITNTVIINKNKRLITNIDTVIGNIENDGNLLFNNNGTNNNYIYGNGITTIDGEVINNNTIATNVKINENKKLTTNATNINGQIENNGNLFFNGGTNSNTIVGNGTTVIDGDIINTSAITTHIKISENKQLRTVATDIYGQIENNGFYNVVSGTISYNISSVSKGTINIKDNKITINENVLISNNNINLATELKLLNEGSLKTSTLTINNGAILNTQNDKTGTVDVASIVIEDGANWTYQIDVDLKSAKADNLINVESVGNGSKATIDDIHLLSDKATKTSIIIADNDIKAEIAQDNFKIYTTNLSYGVTTSLDSNSNTLLNIEAIGYGGLANAVYDGINSYSVTEDVDYLTKWIQDPIGTIHNKIKGNLTISNISSNSRVLKSTTNANGLITEGWTLQINNVNLEGFNEAIKVNNANGNLQLTNVIFSSNTGNAVITSSGTVELSGVVFDNTNTTNIDVINDNRLILSGSSTTFTKGVIGKGTTTINGASINLANAIIEQNKIEITVNGSLTAKANNITADIENNSSLIFTEGTNNNYIYGNGLTTIDGEIINSSTIATNVKINEDKQLTTNAENINGQIENNGDLIFNGGTNYNYIYGNGITTIDGEVINSSTIVNNVRINENKKLTTNATNITGNIENNSSLIFTEGTNNNWIYGTGTTTIDGEVINSSTIATNVKINENKQLTTNAEDIEGQIENDGSLIFNAGTNDNYIYGNGNLAIEGYVVNNSNITQSTITVASAGKIENNNKLQLTNYVNNGITVNNSTITVSGEYYNVGITTNTNYIKASTYTNKTNSVTNNTGIIEVDKLDIEKGSIFNTSLDNVIIKGDFENNAEVIVKNGEIKNNIIGEGKLIIENTVISNKDITQSSMTINPKATFTNNKNVMIDQILTNNGQLTNEGNIETGQLNNVANSTITNNSNFTVNKKGQNYGRIDGNGILNINDDFDNFNYLKQRLINISSGTFNNENIVISDDINLQEKAKLISNASNISGNILNAGNVILTGGQNKNWIHGTGLTTIDGEVINSSEIATNVKINEEKQLTTSAESINGDIINNGTLIFNSGTENNNKITGIGKLHINCNLTNNKIIRQKELNLSSVSNIQMASALNKSSNNNPQLLLFTNDSEIEVETLNLKDTILKLTEKGSLAADNLSSQNSAMDLANNKTQEHIFKTISVTDTLNLSVDVDLTEKQADTIFADNYNEAGKIEVKEINILNEVKGNKAEIELTSSTALKDKINVTDTANSKYFKYNVGYNKNAGTLNFAVSSKDNPTMVESQVAAAAGGFITQTSVLNQAFESLDKKRKSMLYKNPNRIEGGLWLRPFMTQDTVSFTNLEIDNSLTGTLAGIDLLVKKNGLVSFYLGYAGSEQKYEQVKVTQTGYILGATGMIVKQEYYLGLSANIIFNKAEGQSEYGTDKFDMNMYSLGAKAGYNFEINEKWTLEPNLMLMYGNVNSQEYKNVKGAKVEGQSNANIVIEPQIKAKLSLTNGWQPYGLLGYVINAGDKVKAVVEGVEFEEQKIENYVEYGAGVEKSFKNSPWSLYLQITGKSGDRTGFDGNLGIKYSFLTNREKNRIKKIIKTKFIEK